MYYKRVNIQQMNQTRDWQRDEEKENERFQQTRHTHTRRNTMNRLFFKGGVAFFSFFCYWMKRRRKKRNQEKRGERQTDRQTRTMINIIARIDEVTPWLDWIQMFPGMTIRSLVLVSLVWLCFPLRLQQWDRDRTKSSPASDVSRAAATEEYCCLLSRRWTSSSISEDSESKWRSYVSAGSYADHDDEYT